MSSNYLRSVGVKIRPKSWIRSRNPVYTFKNNLPIITHPSQLL